MSLIRVTWLAVGDNDTVRYWVTTVRGWPYMFHYMYPPGQWPKAPLRAEIVSETGNVYNGWADEEVSSNV